MAAAPAHTVAQAKPTRVKIPASEVPTAVRQAVAKQYPGYHIDDAVKISNGESGTTYDLELEGSGKKEIHVVFNSAGKVLSTRADD